MAEEQGRLAVVVVEATAGMPGAVLVEVTLGDQVLTIGEQGSGWPLSDDMRQLAVQLVAQAMREYEEHSNGSRT
ncbi:MAG: hypothetical protein KatS3mg051_1421 [Anaerolineae bacterium]|nr:MAG: hypothetical protein KatS3mg051_1421 [Anaerolineae bacterium]